eukprot:3529321-Lingulodinium_polyedra.AAC.1
MPCYCPAMTRRAIKHQRAWCNQNPGCEQSNADNVAAAQLLPLSSRKRESNNSRRIVPRTSLR